MTEPKMTFVLHTPQGDVTMQVLFTFYSPETRANYMLYTPDSLDTGDAVSLAACRYDPADLSRIMPLADENDRKVVQGFINYLATADREELEKLEQGS